MQDSLECLEFDIACEIGECERPAKFMIKGCADQEHLAACPECMLVIQQNFYAWAVTGMVCFICQSPMMLGLYAHFDVRPI